MNEDAAPKQKVLAGALGAGIAGGVGFVGAPEVAALIVDLTGLSLTEAGLQGLAIVVAILVSAIGSFAFGYMKKEAA